MKRSQVFPSTYLGKDDVPQPFTATVGVVRLETIKGDGGEEEKPVLHFTGEQQKPMILNSTNWSILEEAYGEESDGWQGKPVEVYVDPGVMFAGRRVGGVRLRIPSPFAGLFAPTNGVWTMEQAVAECAKVGISRQQLADALKAEGKTGWLPSRDTPAVQQLILRTKHEGNEEIPFGFVPFMPLLAGMLGLAGAMLS
jgi:hypothetical protein